MMGTSGAAGVELLDERSVAVDIARETLAGWLVGGGLALLLYVLVGYPLLLVGLARWRPRPVVLALPDPPPRVSLLISAYNEERHLPGKLESLWRLDYPPEQMEVIVADDGSTDGTRAAVERLAAEPAAAGRLRLLEATGNLGKASQLNRLAAAASGEILIFTDARQPLDPAAARALVACFADPAVGGVSGDVEYRTPEGDRAPIGAYWRYESLLRTAEGRLHSCCGATGPLLAFRRELWRDLPGEVVLDDMLGPLWVVLGGRRFVFAPEALAIETFSMSRRHEYDRRVRTLAGNYQLLRLEPRLLAPWRNPIWWQFISHKVGRLLVPWCLAAILVGSLLGLGRHPAFGWLLAAQGAFYLYALVGWAGAGRPWAPFGSSLAYNLVLLAATALAGLVRDLRGGSTGRWGAAERHRR